MQLPGKAAVLILTANSLILTGQAGAAGIGAACKEEPGYRAWRRAPFAGRDAVPFASRRESADSGMDALQSPLRSSRPSPPERPAWARPLEGRAERPEPPPMPRVERPLREYPWSVNREGAGSRFDALRSPLRFSRLSPPGRPSRARPPEGRAERPEPPPATRFERPRREYPWSVRRSLAPRPGFESFRPRPERPRPPARPEWIERSVPGGPFSSPEGHAGRLRPEPPRMEGLPFRSPLAAARDHRPLFSAEPSRPIHLPPPPPFSPPHWGPWFPGLPAAAVTGPTPTKGVAAASEETRPASEKVEASQETQSVAETMETSSPAVARPLDGDGDGVADAGDLCPGSAAGQQVDGFGCSAEEPLILRGVNFHSDSDRLTDESTRILDLVAATLVADPEQRVEIAGHTDSDGDDVHNLELSQRRAIAVMKYLFEQGVAADRLQARGYGEGSPLAGNDTPEGRASNRRVELKRMP